MLAPTATQQRLLKLTQLLLTFVSVCAVVDSSLSAAPAADRPGYYAGAAQQRDAERDRRYGDLVRTERKRREAEQHANRRRAVLGTRWRVNGAEEPSFSPASGASRVASTDSRICATCRFSETLSEPGTLQHDKDQLLAYPTLMACDLQPAARTA